MADYLAEKFPKGGDFPEVERPKEYDKRDDIAKRESKREIERVMKSRGRE